MTSLLELPNEIILLIVNYLQASFQQVEVHVPFYMLGDAHRYTIDHNQPRIVGYLRSLNSCSHRFHRLITPLLYRDILVCDHYLNEGRSRLSQLNQTLRQNPHLLERVHSASIPCAYNSPEAILSIVPFFWYANMKTLTIHKFNYLSPLEYEDSSHVGTSPVECLKLIDCGAQEEALARVFSWPAALKRLHYDAEQLEWIGDQGDEPAKEWTAAAFVRTLQTQKSTLEEFIMTRPWLEHEGLFNGPRINLSGFVALKTLRIYHVFLCGWDGPSGVWRDLPPNLEVLEVFYDDTDLTEFQNEYDPDGYDTFLADLIRHKRSHLPHLHTVTIYSPERLYNFEEDYDGREALTCLWEPPSSLASEAEAAGIKLNVWLGTNRSVPWDRTEVFWHLID
jgi:hypothetical protein